MRLRSDSLERVELSRVGKVSAMLRRRQDRGGRLPIQPSLDACDFQTSSRTTTPPMLIHDFFPFSRANQRKTFGMKPPIQVQSRLLLETTSERSDAVRGESSARSDAKVVRELLKASSGETLESQDGEPNGEEVQREE